MSVTTLTKRLVATAQPKDRAYELRDTQVRGLLLRVQPSGHKAWVITWEHGKRRTLGSAGHLTLDEAREIARKIIAEYIQTGLPSIAKPAAQNPGARLHHDAALPKDCQPSLNASAAESWCCSRRSWSTSANDGMAANAPLRVTASAPTAAPKRMASARPS
jgi:hypothetical protein